MRRMLTVWFRILWWGTLGCVAAWAIYYVFLLAVLLKWAITGET